jgi:Na+/H+ antiporter NhaD/arsenite permease-like protein
MEQLLIFVFVVGYFLIAIEHSIKVNKAATALVIGVLSWTIYILFSGDKAAVNSELSHHLSELSGILFFLLGAMTTVELIDSHNGFDIIARHITQSEKRKLLWIISMLAFFLSAVLDNLTTTIIMVSLIRKLIKDEKTRLIFCGMVIIAANAGGAWSPIGDVTTTMLWIGGQITSGNIIVKLFFPSLICVVIPLIIFSFKLKGQIERQVTEEKMTSKVQAKQQFIVFMLGMLVLILVPVFKSVTSLPPYMGILFGLGVLWITTEIIHSKLNEHEKHELSVASALQRIDVPSVLFFFGILVTIAALQSSGILGSFATWLAATIKNENLLVLSFGMVSAVVDNVPLVAAVQAMYGLDQYPTDHYFWEFLAYCTGTGGSTLIIGSAAGVAAMGIEKISFTWYLKNISLLALFAYLAGAVVYILEHQLF